MAGMRSGDADLWWPYVETVVRSLVQERLSRASTWALPTPVRAAAIAKTSTRSIRTCTASCAGCSASTPALHEGRLDICPAFPSDWREASIRTPDVSYQYRREADRATFHIRTPRPLVKRVRGNLTGQEAVTPQETESVLSVPLGPPVPALQPPKHPPTILAEQQPPTEADRGRGIQPHERARLVLFDLSQACNVTAEQMAETQFIYDDKDARRSRAFARRSRSPFPAGGAIRG